MSTDTLLWIAFALVAVACFAIIVYDERRHRRELKRIRVEFERDVDRKRVGL